MEIIKLNNQFFRNKVITCVDKYTNLSKYNNIAIGMYFNDKFYTFGNGTNKSYIYDIGSISKTITAHLILFLKEKNLLDLNDTIDKYISLKGGIYPTIYQLLTHTAGYINLTPFEIVVPSLLKSGYSRKNIYEKCNEETIIKCLNKRRKNKKNNHYGYSDFSYAILAILCEKVTNRKFFELFTDFIKNELKLSDSELFVDEKNRYPKAIKNNRVLKFWKWNENNPYIASGGVSCTLIDMLKYIDIQINSKAKYIVDAHNVCVDSFTKKSKIGTCIGWHTYKKSNQLWHVGGVGTFRSSIIINKHKKCGVIVLGNAQGIRNANVHYLAKMLYSEIKLMAISP